MSGPKTFRVISSLRARLIAFVLLSVLPAFGLILLTDQRHRASIATQVQKNALSSARVIVTEQRRIFENAHQLLITLARLPQIREQNTAGCRKILAGLLEPLYIDLGVVDLKGNLLCNALGADAYQNWRFKEFHLRRVAQDQDLTIGEIRQNGFNGKTIIELGFPIADSPGSLRGIAYVVLDFSWIVRITAENNLPSKATFSLFNEDGKIFLLFPNASNSPNPNIDSTAIKFVRGVEGNIRLTGKDQAAHLFTFRQMDHRVAGNIVYAGINIPSREAFAEAKEILRQNLIALGVLTLLTLIAAWFGADLFVLRRVGDLLSATKQLAAGNLRARTGLPYGESELGYLARTFDDLAAALEKRAVDAKIAESQIQTQNLRLKTTHEISSAMTATLEMGNVLTALSDGISLLFPSSCVSLAWLAEDGELGPISSTTPSGEMSLREIADREKGLPQEVFNLKAPLLVSNLQNDRRCSDAASLSRAGLVTYFGLPLIVGEEILGVLSFYSKHAFDISTEEHDFLSHLGDQAAIALYNSRLYEQTRNQATELTKSNRIKDEFLGVVSHELRTPLNIIMNCVEAMKMGLFGEITQEHEKGTEKIRAQANHLLSLINGILEITKIESGSVVLNRQPLDLHEVVAGLESDYAIECKDKAVTISWQLPSNLPTVVTDAMKFRQIIINLVNNAIKFTDQGSVDIVFSALPDNSSIEFAVSDTGMGIAPQFLSEIFEKFRQIDSTTTRHHSGAGLGLYLVKSFVEQLCGSITVKSELGVGTTFIVRLPVNMAQGDFHEKRPLHTLLGHRAANYQNAQGDL